MKIKWWVEGTGCNAARCAMPERTLDIDDAELAGLSDLQRERHIEDVLDEEFRREVYPQWTEATP